MPAIWGAFEISEKVEKTVESAAVSSAATGSAPTANVATGSAATDHCTIQTFADCMTAQYSNYKLDGISDYILPQGKICYGNQLITPESQYEKQPIYDEKNQILFCADCMLDNREDLIQRLHLSLTGTEKAGEIHAGYKADTTSGKVADIIIGTTCEMSDGYLLYLSYLKWKERLTDYVIGIFSIAVYHLDSKVLELFTDHMGSRSLFICQTNHRIYFSTLLVPLARVLQTKPSKKWMAGCLCNVSADMTIFEDLTPFEGILQLPAACHLTWQKGKAERSIYWDQSHVGRIYPHRDPMDYRDLFVNTLKQATASMMRSKEEIGCTLSGGLDSSTVASLAADILEDEPSDMPAYFPKKLYSFTSVPLEDFNEPLENTEIADETPYVKEICKMHPNIIPEFVDCPEKDAFSELERLIPLIGYPAKSGPNLAWLDDIYTKASAKGCRIMLKGQYGNSTISYGGALYVLYQQLCTARWKDFRRTLHGFSSAYRVPRKRVLQTLFREWSNRFSDHSLKKEDILIPDELYEKSGIPQAFRKKLKTGGGYIDNRKERVKFIFNPYALMQLGMYDTAMSLIHGIIIRDPTKDKRVVEVCCRLPAECQLAGYVERGQIRTYMKGIVPDCILDDYFKRGVQSRDYTFRSQKLWGKNKASVQAALAQEAEELSNYVKPEVLNEVAKTADQSPEQFKRQDIIRMNVVYSAAVFLREFLC